MGAQRICKMKKTGHEESDGIFFGSEAVCPSSPRFWEKQSW